MAEQAEHQRYGRCVVERVIGHGARSTVYLAWHEAFQIPVAVKVMGRGRQHEDEEFSERFLREARIAAQLTHPNIVRVYDCGETDESYYLVLEYIEGETCRDKLEQWGVFDWQRAVQIIRQVSEGLRYASKKGIIHRDLKPENIMIDSEGNVRIADLGLAKEVVPGRASATVDGDVLGTPYYMSPEQVRQPGEVDFRSDIYSLGVTLYHLVTGEVPFEAATPFEIMAKHLDEPLTHPREIKPDLPEPLCEIVLRAMSKDPDERYQGYDELIGDLDALLEGVEAGEPALMGHVDAVLDEAPEPSEPEEPGGTTTARPRVRPIRPVELLVTVQNVRTKVLGILAVLAYVFVLVSLHHLLLARFGPVPAVAATVGLLALSAACAWSALRRGLSKTDSEVPGGLEQEVSAALGRLCERLGLPVPRVRLDGSRSPLWGSYSLFSRKGTIHLPGRWMRSVELKDEHVHAMVAQCLAGFYNGDADFRTLLALPVGFIRVGRLLGRLVQGASPETTWRVARLGWLVLLVTLCGLIAWLFFVSSVAGGMGLLCVGVLVLTAAFERHSRLAADSFAVKALEGPGPVQGLAVLAGLSSVECYPLLEDTVGAKSALTLGKGPPVPPQVRRITSTAVTHYAEVQYVHGTLELVGKLFSMTPVAPERLNHLAGVPSRRAPLAALVAYLKRLYALLLGTGAREATTMLELGGVGLFALSGAAGGALAVIISGLLLLHGGLQYSVFLMVVGALSLAAGMLLAPRVFGEGLSASRLGWACVVCAVAFTLVAGVGFCLAGSERLSTLAFQIPVVLFIVAVCSSVGAVLYCRIAAALGMERRRGLSPAGSETAYTLMMPRSSTAGTGEEEQAAGQSEEQNEEDS